MFHHHATDLFHEIRNIAGGYTHTQGKVRDLTQDSIEDPYGYELREIANLTFKEGKVEQIMPIIYQRLNDKGTHYRHVEKGMILLHFLVQYGSESVINSVNHNRLLLNALSDYHHTENGQEVGSKVRSLAQETVELLTDEPKLTKVRSECAIELKEKSKKDREQEMRHNENAALAATAFSVGMPMMP